MKGERPMPPPTEWVKKGGRISTVDPALLTARLVKQYLVYDTMHRLIGSDPPPSSHEQQYQERFDAMHEAGWELVCRYDSTFIFRRRPRESAPVWVHVAAVAACWGTVYLCAKWLVS